MSKTHIMTFAAVGSDKIKIFGMLCETPDCRLRLLIQKMLEKTGCCHNPLEMKVHLINLTL